MSRRKIEHRLFKRGQPLRVPLNKDTAGSGSVEIKHLDFTTTTSNLVDLNDADVIAVRDTSDSSMKAVKLGALKAYVSGSQATGRSGSIQFNIGGDFGGALTFTTDGTHMTASAKNNPGTYIFRLTSGSIKGAGHTYGPANGNIPQYLEVQSSGSERYLFFPSDGTSTTKPTALSLNLELDRADSEYREVRIEAKSGITDWRDVADNFFEQMKLELETRAGIATVTSSSAGSITATASITVAYSTLGGGVAVGGGKFTNLGSPTATHRLRQPAGFTPGGDNASSADVPLANNAGQNKNGPGNEPANTGIFVESSVSGSDASNAAIYFTNAALGVSPKHQKIVSNADGVIEIQATATGSGQVTLKGGSGVNIRTVTNKGFIFDNIGTAPAIIDGRDVGTVARSNILFNTRDNAHPVVTFRSGSTEVFGTHVLTTSASAGTYVFRLTSGSIKAAGHTYGPANGNQTQFLEVASSGSERYLFFLSDGTSTTKPTALSLNLELDRADSEYREVRVEAKAGITDWRDVADNFFEQMKLELQTRTSLATVTSSSAGSITATASITIAYASLAGGVSVGNGKFDNLGSPTATHRLRQPSGFTPGADNASSGNHPIANNAGNDAKTTGEPSNTGIFVESTTSGSAASTANHIQLRQSNGKMYFDNGTTYFAGASTNVQYLTASQAKIGTLDVEEIVSRSTTKDSLELNDKLIIAAVSGSKHADFVGAGFQVGGKTAAQGTGSAALISMTLGDPALNQGSMIMKVNDTRIVSVTSGSFFNNSKFAGMMGVTGALSASYARAQTVSAKLVSGSALTVQRLVTNKIAGDGIITVDNIKTGSVATGHFADAAVTHAKIGVGAVRPDNLDTGSILTAHISDAQVTHAKFAVGAVRPDNLDTGSILTAHITDAQVTHAKLATGALTADNIQTGSVNTAHLVAGSVTHVKLATGAIKNDNISTGSVEHDHLATGAITSDNIQTGSINTAHIAAAAVTHAKIGVGAVRPDNLDTGSILTAHISDAQVTHAKFGVGSVRPDNLDTGSILTAHITDAQVTHGKLAVGAVTLDNLDTGSVLTAHVGTGQVTHAKLSQTKAGSGNTVLDFSGFTNFGLGSFSVGETLKIGDGTRVLTFTGVDASGNSATGSLDFGVGSDRATVAVVTELSTKINNSALDAIAQRSGTTITMTPSASVTLTVQEDPSPGNGVFGSAAGNLVVSLSSPATEGAITADNLQTGSVDAGQLVAGSVTTDKIAETIAGTYVIRLTSGSTGRYGNKTYGPVNNSAQLIHCVGTGSSDFMFFLDNAGGTNPPSAQSVNFLGTAQEFRVEAHTGITDWRDVAANFFEKMKAQLQTNTSIATVTSQSAANINGTASITVAYNSIPGGVRVGGGRNSSRAIHDKHSQPASASPFNASTDPTVQSPIQTGGSSGVSEEPNHNGGFVQTTTSGSSAPVRRDNFGTGSVEHDHLAGAVLTVDNIATGSVNTPHFADGAVGMDALATGSVSGNQLNKMVVRNGSDANGGLSLTNTPGTYVIRLTSGSVGRYGNKTYGPVNNTAQLIQCVGTGSSDFMFFLDNAGGTNPPSAQSVNFTGTAQEIRVEAHTGVTDWRDVAGNFFEKMKAQLDTNTGIATVTSSSAVNVKGTASITVAYNSLGGGVRVGSGRNGSRNFHIAHSMPVSTTPFNASTDPAAGSSQIQTGQTSGQSGEPAFNGAFPETITSGSDEAKLQISFVRKDYGRSGNKFISNVMGSPFTTASLSAQPLSGTLEVYFNGVLLLGDHPKSNAGGPTQADYRLVTASANAYQVRLNEDLALDSDDILTITFYSGSNPA